MKRTFMVFVQGNIHTFMVLVQENIKAPFVEAQYIFKPFINGYWSMTNFLQNGL